MHILKEIIKSREQNKHAGVYAACSASPVAIEAVLESALASNGVALIESTANQSNQFGGYTGMLPADFVRLVHGIARKVGFPQDKLMLGGDHLGPLVWRSLSPSFAMAKAEKLITSYVLAGFDKLHIDTSMPLGSEGTASNEDILKRAIRLIKIAEAAATQAKMKPPVYIIGSEVPMPGGGQGNDDELSVTSVESFKSMIKSFKLAFEKEEMNQAWERVVAAVVQPGVEFSDEKIYEYDRSKAKSLTDSLKEHKGMVFEGHSTDYQRAQNLREMVEDGIAILKVGPALTFAQRECLFALSEIECELCPDEASNYRYVLERVMTNNPAYWEKYYQGDERELALKRKYSFADRSRYYLCDKSVNEAYNTLCENLTKTPIPLSLISQYLPKQYERLREGELPCLPAEIIKDYIRQNCISLYESAISLN